MRARRLVLPTAAIAAMAFAAWCAARPAEPPCRIQTFEGSRFQLCPFDPSHHQLRLLAFEKSGRPLRTFRRLVQNLGDDAGRVRYAMNAGMFDPDGAPIGLYVEQGSERTPLNRADGPGNFHLKPNGVFWLDEAGPHVATTDAYVALAPRPQFATQSGPMLVIDGALHPSFDQDGASRHLRNGVGVCQGETVFVISETPVSFGRFARLFRDPLKCSNALYLDGVVSSLWVPARRRMEQRAALGPFVVVSDKPEE